MAKVNMAALVDEQTARLLKAKLALEGRPYAEWLAERIAEELEGMEHSETERR